MGLTQNTTHPDLPPDQEAKIAAQQALSMQQQAFVDFKALNGLVYDGKTYNESGDLKLRKVSVTEFAEILGVHRDTLYRWQNTIPGFWERVNQRRTELAPQSRLALVHENWFVAAAQVKNWQVTEAWLRNFDPNFKEAHAKQAEDAANTLLDVLEIARNTRRTVMEGEVVDGSGQNSHD